MAYDVFQKNPEAGAKKVFSGKIPFGNQEGKKSRVESKIENQDEKTYSGNIGQPEKGSPKKNKTKEITQKKRMARILKSKKKGNESNPGKKFTIKWREGENEKQSREDGEEYILSNTHIL